MTWYIHRTATTTAAILTVKFPTLLCEHGMTSLLLQTYQNSMDEYLRLT